MFYPALPELGSKEVLLIVLLGFVNTAVAFTPWHHAMRTLNALHAGIIASAQVVEVPVPAFVILGEALMLSRAYGSVVVLGESLLSTSQRLRTCVKSILRYR